MSIPTHLLLLTLAVTVSLSVAQIRVVGTGSDIREGPFLTDNQVFCPGDFSRKGFSIECVGDPAATGARFIVNRKIRPVVRGDRFFINGINDDGRVRPWRNFPRFPRAAVIICKLNTAQRFKVRVIFQCGDDDDMPMPVPLPEPMPEPMPVPNAVETSGDGCVVIDARSSTVPGDWVRTNDGIAYKPTDSSIGVDGVNDIIRYGFTVPVRSQYAFVLDMTTNEVAEHNDVWANFPSGGFIRTRDGVIRGGAQTFFIKVYHNNFKRDTLANTIDNDAHSIATASELEPGVNYEVEISGRSTMVTLHRIIMFPCSDPNCHRTHPSWQQQLPRCAAL